MLKVAEEIKIISGRIGAYAGLWTSMNTKNQEARAFEHKMSNYLSELGNKMIFFSLWFKSLDDENMNRVIREAGVYSYYFERIKAGKQYALTEAEEKIINIKDVTGGEALNSIYDVITNAFIYDFKINRKVKKVTGDELRSNFSNPNAKIRERSYKLLLNKYGENKDSLGEIYKNIVTDWGNETVKVRKYRSFIAPRNLGNDITDKAVETMLKSAKDNRKVFQRFFKLKARLNKVKKLRRYDLYVNAKSKDTSYSYDEAINLVLNSFNEFSPKVRDLAFKIIEANHVDSVVLSGKQSGAFCCWVDNKIPPYVLVNFNKKERDVSTLAHELGHGVHDLLTNNVPLLLAHPPLIFAETASIFSEMILSSNLLANETNKNKKISMIDNKIIELYQTVMRQAYFTLFELEAHKAINDGATVDQISWIYLKNLKEQFGDSVDISDDFKHEWLYVSHFFHSPFYCYAYSFGNLITLALYQMYIEQGEEFVPRYLKFLSYGGSEKPMRIAAELGIDLESEVFWSKGFKLINDLIDEFELLVK
jgi:oligoendopeptidase F